MIVMPKAKRKLTIREKRVQLAKDVIKHVSSYDNQIEVSAGSYIEGNLAYVIAQKLDYGNDDDVPESDDDVPESDAREFLKATLPKTPCDVCAKGALLISHVLRNDKMSLKRFYELSHNMSSCTLSGTDTLCGRETYPKGIAFTPKQLDEIEALFEGDVVGRARDSFTDLQLSEMRNWHIDNNTYDSLDLLVRIMKLVIKNKGAKVLL